MGPIDSTNSFTNKISNFFQGSTNKVKTESIKVKDAALKIFKEIYRNTSILDVVLLGGSILAISLGGPWGCALGAFGIGFAISHVFVKVMRERAAEEEARNKGIEKEIKVEELNSKKEKA